MDFISAEDSYATSPLCLARGNRLSNEAPFKTAIGVLRKKKKKADVTHVMLLSPR